MMPVSRVMDDAPAILIKDLKELGLSASERHSLRKRYGLSAQECGGNNLSLP